MRSITRYLSLRSWPKAPALHGLAGGSACTIPSSSTFSIWMERKLLKLRRKARKKG